MQRLACVVHCCLGHSLETEILLLRLYLGLLSRNRSLRLHAFLLAERDMAVVEVRSASTCDVFTSRGCSLAGDQDDIVLQTFKQQQKSYRALLEGLKV